MTKTNEDRITVTIGAGLLTHAHSLGWTPTDVIPVATTGEAILVWSDSAPDGTNVYMRASKPVTVNLVVQRWV